VITGYGVVCTEIVEKIMKCPDCGGKGFIVQTAAVKVIEPCPFLKKLNKI
jgi:hypothetical protein